jgi:hypothetical protein
VAATEDREGLGGQLRRGFQGGSTEELIGCVVSVLGYYRQVYGRLGHIGITYRYMDIRSVYQTNASIHRALEYLRIKILSNCA